MDAKQEETVRALELSLVLLQDQALDLLLQVREQQARLRRLLDLWPQRRLVVSDPYPPKSMEFPPQRMGSLGSVL